MSNITVAATQMACSWDRDANLARAEKLIREAAQLGANVILIQELFETPYFCKDHAALFAGVRQHLLAGVGVRRIALVQNRHVALGEPAAHEP